MSTALLTLDDRAEWERFSRALAATPGRWESFLAIEGMTCPACTLTVEAALGALPGVDEVQVDGASATARIAWRPGAARPSQWFEALHAAGLTGLPAGDLLDAAPRRASQRATLWRWLVAGFCMMQVMMYATPAYIAAPGEIGDDSQALLRWAAWILTLPVVLFSCAPFFGAALRDLRHRRVGMDVPVALGILIAFAASTVATFDPRGALGGEVWFDSVTMFVFFLLSGRLLEQRLRDRTAGSLRALVRTLPQSVERQRPDGGFEAVNARQLAVGDRIRVKPGEAIAADGIVREGESRVDEALLTGESKPVARGPGSEVVAGSHNLVAPLLVEVMRTGADTRFAQVVALMAQAAVQKPQAARLADRFAGPFLLGVLLAAALAALAWWPHGPGRALGVAVAVLIVTCPCALSLATPAATLAAAGALARRGVLVRRLEAIEAAASLDTVVFDKTGTLTQDRMAVRAVRTREGMTANEALALAGALAGSSLHPVSRALANAASTGEPCGPVHDVVETPGQGIGGWIARADGTRQALRLGHARFCDAPAAAASHAHVHLADRSGWLAAFELDESLRDDAVEGVAQLARLGLGLRLLSGDRAQAVSRLARRVGIASSFGAQSPEQKLAHVRAAQHEGRRVAMVGDGLNDGPVLAVADVSVAMGSAVPLAEAKSDFVVPGAQVGAVALIVAHARRTRAVVRQNLAWAAAYNALAVPLALAGWMPPWLAGLGMAASSLAVVANSARLARIAPLR